jgi:hypothetical protein
MADAKNDKDDLRHKLRHELAMLRKDAGDDEPTATAFVDKVEEDAEDANAALEAEVRKLKVAKAKDGGQPELEVRVDAPEDRGVSHDRGSKLPLLTPEEAAVRRAL